MRLISKRSGGGLKDDSAIIRLAAIRARDRLGQPLSIDEASETLGRPRRGLTLLSFVGEEDRDGVRLFTAYLRGAAARHGCATAPKRYSARLPIATPPIAVSARHIGDFGAKLRTELENGFRRYFSEHWPNGIAPRLSVSLAHNLLSGLVSPEEGKKARPHPFGARRDRGVTSQGRPVAKLVRRVVDENGISPTHSVIGYLQLRWVRARMPRRPR